MKKVCRVLDFSAAVSTVAVMSLITIAQADPVTYTWVGGAANDRFNQAANWSPAGGPPGAGDIANIGGTFRVEISTATMMEVGAIITLNDSAFIERNSIHRAHINGTVTFSDSSYLRLSQMRLTDNVTLNWNSTGTWEVAPAGTNSPMFQFTSGFATTAATANMSNGTWLLTTEDDDTAFLQDIGTFNMTGGQIIANNEFQLGSATSAGTFNLGGSGAVYTPTFTVLNDDSVFNFQGLNSSLWIEGVGSQSQLETRVNHGRVYIDNEKQSNMDNFIWSTQSFNDTDYTRISVIPEPATGAILFLALTGVVAELRRRRYAR